MNRAKPTTVRRPSAAAKPSGASLSPLCNPGVFEGLWGSQLPRSLPSAWLFRSRGCFQELDLETLLSVLSGYESPWEAWDSGDFLRDPGDLVSG